MITSHLWFVGPNLDHTLQIMKMNAADWNLCISKEKKVYIVRGVTRLSMYVKWKLAFCFQLEKFEQISSDGGKHQFSPMKRDWAACPSICASNQFHISMQIELTAQIRGTRVSQWLLSSPDWQLNWPIMHSLIVFLLSPYTANWRLDCFIVLRLLQLFKASWWVNWPNKRHLSEHFSVKQWLQFCCFNGQL